MRYLGCQLDQRIQMENPMGKNFSRFFECESDTIFRKKFYGNLMDRFFPSNQVSPFQNLNSLFWSFDIIQSSRNTFVSNPFTRLKPFWGKNWPSNYKNIWVLKLVFLREMSSWFFSRSDFIFLWRLLFERALVCWYNFRGVFFDWSQKLVLH